MFRRIAADLRDAITAGQIQPGQMVPSETRLSQEYRVSRLTARAAVNLLRAEGLAELVAGRGVIVREAPVLDEVQLPAGATVTARMPTMEERAEFDIPDGVPVLSVMSADGVAVFPADRCRLRAPKQPSS